MNTESKPAGNGSSFSRLSTPLSPASLDRKRQIIRFSVLAAAILLIALGVSVWASSQSQKAQDAFNTAMDVYDAPVQRPGDRPIPNVKTYPSAAARAKVANPLFRAAADRYGLFRAGRNARYFAGLTALDLGDTAAAEADLKKTANARDSGLAALGKMALAGLYSTTNRGSQAAGLYESVIAHPTLTVSANAARLAFAAAVAGTDPQKSRELYAKVKDADKTTAAGQIATQRLGGK